MMIEFSIIPIGEESHIGKYIAAAVKIVHESGMEYRLTPMGTIIVGEWEPAMNLIRKCHEAVRQMSDRVITRIKIDDFGKERMPEEKVKAVESLLGFEVKK
ncbi:MAG: MTH1187 family thiamine-binding protein [candidate division KSB1 bacterium]|nr:MTH1187 family thiamine-binding protein [candidate division KSB1 bacterium]MDZ7301147.1 MTH1187 family thiamine-binding protein [candidate division KSB1 bacterium]MDZ7311969.1 MTH1187 family thiamine-binding protein [candidate division KSB1 bacterium]